MTDDEKPTPPDEATCPECGEPATEDSVVKVQLSNLGYMHEDTTLECVGCGNTWIHGVPVGEGGEDDLECPCGTTYLIHRVRVQWQAGKVILDAKCPNCAHFPMPPLEREIDSTNKVALVGYPEITGDQSEAAPLGWIPDDDHEFEHINEVQEYESPSD